MKPLLSISIFRKTFVLFFAILFFSFAYAAEEDTPDISSMPPLQNSAPSSNAPKGADDKHVSFVPPAGWKINDEEGSKFKIATGPPSSGFIPNITVSEAIYPGTLQQLIEENVKNLKSHPKEFKFISQNSFNLKSGVKGTKVVIDILRQNRAFRSAQYVFEVGKDRTFMVVNCVTPAEEGSRYNDLFDRCMSTFVVQ